MFSFVKNRVPFLMAAGFAGFGSSIPRHASVVHAEAASVASMRLSYSRQGIHEKDMPEDPYGLFQQWFSEAVAAKVIEPNAMCLSTCKDNTPSARYVLLKAHDDRGYVWFTNYNSRKGQELIENPKAALTFWWGDLERSIRIEGRVEKISDDESDEYFNSRPRGSRIGAWASNQSNEIESREAFDKQEKDINEKFQNIKSIPRPPHWGGFRLIPIKIEFWKGRESRMHDRIVYERKNENEKWEKIKRLQS